MEKPSIFIGSSSESIFVAEGVESNLWKTCICRKWTNIFKSGSYTLETLVEELEKVDYAAFILAPDDITNIRGDKLSTARDNVIFELGLFMGILGRKRTFILLCSNNKNFRLPTDLDGVGILYYTDDTDDYKINTSHVCNEIKDRVRKFKSKKTSTETNDSVQKNEHDKKLSIEENLLLYRTRNLLAEFLVKKYNNAYCSFTDISEMKNKLVLKSRKFIIDFIKDLEEEELIVKGKTDNNKTGWKLNEKGYKILVKHKI